MTFKSKPLDTDDKYSYTFSKAGTYEQTGLMQDASWEGQK